MKLDRKSLFKKVHTWPKNEVSNFSRCDEAEIFILLDPLGSLIII